MQKVFKECEILQFLDKLLKM